MLISKVEAMVTPRVREGLVFYVVWQPSRHIITTSNSLSFGHSLLETILRFYKSLLKLGLSILDLFQSSEPSFLRVSILGTKCRAEKIE